MQSPVSVLTLSFLKVISSDLVSFFFSSRRRHTRCLSDWSSDVCSSDLGPVWFGDGRYLLWSDIPNDRILKWEEETGAISVFRRPSHDANGNTRDRQGR